MGCDEAFVTLGRRTNTKFWALTEYGRGMGNIHTYTQGLGAMIPTGWSAQGDPEQRGGVFSSIRRVPRTETDWRRTFAEHCGIADSSNVRLWWFYNRKDSEKKHDFRFMDQAAPADAPARSRIVAKIVPVDAAGAMITDPNEKTTGEKLAAQLFKASNDANFK